MRYYLDTNILIFYLFDRNPDDNLDKSILDIFADYETILYTSSVAVCELFHLYKSGDFKTSKYKTPTEVFDALNSIGIEIKPITEKHLRCYSELKTAKGHRDPNDHIIIAQAMSDKIPIISSDNKFKEYVKQGLNFVFNRR